MRKNVCMILTVLAILIFHIINVQASQNVVLLSGIVSDEGGKPVGTSLYFEDMNGKRIQTRSNSTDGAYQQVLPQNEKYLLVLKGFIQVGDMAFTTPSSSDYLEIKKNFTVKKIESGMTIVKGSPFNENKSDLNADKDIFAGLKAFLSNNINVNIIITVHTHDSHFKSAKKKVTETVKGKAKTKTITMSSEEQLKELGNARIETLKSYFKLINIFEKNCTFIIDNKAGVAPAPKKDTKKKGKKSDDSPSTPKYPTVVITVGKIMNM